MSWAQSLIKLSTYEVEVLQKRLGELSPAQEVIAYCRGPWCVFSRDAVAALRAGGLQARHFANGVEHWPGELH